MSHPATHLRTRADIPVVERAGYRYRRHLDVLGSQSGAASFAGLGFGALIAFDDFVIDAGLRVPVSAHDGFEAIAYVLEGECRIEDDRGHAEELARDRAAYIRLGRGVQHSVENRSSTSPLRILVAAVVAPLEDPRPAFTVRSFAGDDPGIVWIASPDGEEHIEGTLRVGASMSLGIANLAPGVERDFPRVWNRGLFVDVLRGYIELDRGFVGEGGDARVSLDAPARIQAVRPSRVVVAQVAMGFSQRIE